MHFPFSDSPSSGPAGRRRIEPGPGQESVWDYPRPPRLEPTDAHVRVEFAGQVLAETRRALRLLETSHPPTFYLPLADVDASMLEPAGGGSFCEWKGRAHYFDLVGSVDGQERRAPRAAWGYADPVAAYAALKDHVAVYAHQVDVCTVDGERVEPQPGDFYGGWITSRVVGPFKGMPGSWGW